MELVGGLQWHQVQLRRRFNRPAGGLPALQQVAFQQPAAFQQDAVFQQQIQHSPGNLDILHTEVVKVEQNH